MWSTSHLICQRDCQRNTSFVSEIVSENVSETPQNTSELCQQTEFKNMFFEENNAKYLCFVPKVGLGTTPMGASRIPAQAQADLGWGLAQPGFPDLPGWRGFRWEINTTLLHYNTARQYYTIVLQYSTVLHQYTTVHWATLTVHYTTVHYSTLYNTTLRTLHSTR